MTTSELDRIARIAPFSVDRIESLFAMLAAPSWRGVDGAIYRVWEGDRPVAVAKVMRAHARHYVDVDAAFSAAAWAEEQDLGPRVIAADAEDGILLMEDLGAVARVVTLDVAREPATLAAILKLTTSLAQRRSGPARDVVSEIERLELTAQRVGAVFPIDWDWIRRGFAQLVENGLTASGREHVFCHGDGNVSNFLIGDGGLRIIDWDLSGVMDPLQDLGAVVAEIAQTSEEVESISHRYLSELRPGDLDRIHGYALADHLRSALIASIVAATATESNEYAKYADWRLLLARVALRDPGFDARVGRLTT